MFCIFSVWSCWNAKGRLEGCNALRSSENICGAYIFVLVCVENEMGRCDRACSQECDRHNACSSLCAVCIPSCLYPYFFVIGSLFHSHDSLHGLWATYWPRSPSHQGSALPALSSVTIVMPIVLQ
jgi:hypothetical protein